MAIYVAAAAYIVVSPQLSMCHSICSPETLLPESRTRVCVVLSISSMLKTKKTLGGLEKRGLNSAMPCVLGCGSWDGLTSSVLNVPVITPCLSAGSAIHETPPSESLVLDHFSTLSLKPRVATWEAEVLTR